VTPSNLQLGIRRVQHCVMVPRCHADFRIPARVYATIMDG